MTAVAPWLIAELSPPQLRRALDFRGMGLPMRLAAASAMGLSPDELDLYEVGREIGDERILDRIEAERKLPKPREPGED